MNKKIADSTIIYADRPVAGYHYLSLFFRSALFVVVVVWLVGLYTETLDFRAAGDTVFIIVLILMVVLSGWVLVRKINRIINVNLERPLLRVDFVGIELFGSAPVTWEDVEYMRLVKEFDQNFLDLKYNGDGEIRFALGGSMETAEFSNLEDLRVILSRYTDKVSSL